MFIRKVYKRNKPGSAEYKSHQLVESVRTEHGVRQKLLLSLGRLPIVEEKHPQLTRRIKEIIQGQETFIGVDSEIEALAQKFARRVLKGMPSPPRQPHMSRWISNRFAAGRFGVSAANTRG